MQYEVKVKKLPGSEVELEVSLPSDLLVSSRKKAMKNLALSLEVPGFRKGNVPENIVVQKVEESKIMEEATNILLREHFPKIVAQEKLDVIGQPQISITKLAVGNPVEFKASFAVMPEFEMPEYEKIAADINKEERGKDEKFEATDKEVNDVLLQIRKNKAHADYHKKNPNEENHKHGGLDLEKEENLPKLDDKLAQEAGSFKNLDELKSKVKENIVAEKKVKKAERTRGKIMEGLVGETKIEVPEVLIENEIMKSLAQMKDNIKRMGVKFEDYLAQVKKTEDDLKKDFRDSSEKKAKIQLIFNKIAAAEKLQPDKEALENEIKELMRHYPEASEQNARVYVATIMLNQKVLKLLENQ